MTAIELTARKAGAIRAGGPMSYELADRQAAASALQEVMGNPAQGSWSGRTWARLALLIRLLDGDERADVFAERAAHGLGEDSRGGQGNLHAPVIANSA